MGKRPRQVEVQTVRPLPEVAPVFPFKSQEQAFREMDVGRKSLEGSQKRAQDAAARDERMVREFLLWREQNPKSNISDSALAAKIGKAYGIKPRMARGIISKALKNNSGKTGEMPS